MTKLLVVVDMQNDFITGPLGTPEAQAIVDSVREKIEDYRRNGDFIVFTQDTHFEKRYPTTVEGTHLPILHCVKGTKGWQIFDGLFSEGAQEHVVVKSSFGLQYWCQRMNVLWGRMCGGFYPGIIEVVGVCTDICVITNAMALKTDYPGAEVYVDASCCAGTSPEMHEAALDVMQSCHINIINRR